MIEAFIIFFLNGVTLEFGDELICFAHEAIGFNSYGSCRNGLRHIIYNGATNYTYIALLGGILGYVISSTFYIYVAFNGAPKTAGDIFKTILTVELIEGCVSVVGQLLTDGVFETAIISLPLSLAAGAIRGGVLAFMFAWDKSDWFEIKVIVLICACAAVLFSSLNQELRSNLSPTTTTQTPEPAELERTLPIFPPPSDPEPTPPSLLITDTKRKFAGRCFNNASAHDIYYALMRYNQTWEFFFMPSGTKRHHFTISQRTLFKMNFRIIHSKRRISVGGSILNGRAIKIEAKVGLLNASSHEAAQNYILEGRTCDILQKLSFYDKIGEIRIKWGW